MQRQWKVKSQDLKALSREARQLAGAFHKISFKHVSREFHIQKQIDEMSRLGPLVKGDTGLRVRQQENDRRWTRSQAAFIQWAYHTGILTVSELSRVFLTDPSTMRKCATGETYGDIGVDDL
jgi:hypothetical protein